MLRVTCWAIFASPCKLHSPADYLPWQIITWLLCLDNSRRSCQLEVSCCLVMTSAVHRAQMLMLHVTWWAIFASLCKFHSFADYRLWLNITWLLCLDDPRRSWTKCLITTEKSANWCQGVELLNVTSFLLRKAAEWIAVDTIVLLGWLRPLLLIGSVTAQKTWIHSK